MALQERPGSGSSSAMGVDVPSAASASASAAAHGSLLSATGAALSFAASFHRDARACRGARERQQLHAIYRDKILAIDGIAANVAAALLPFLRTVRGPGSGVDDYDDERWGDFDRLAQRGKRMRDRESQHLQHQSGIIAAWGLECFEYYGWHAQPLPLLRQLHDLAVLMPRWEDVVDLLNSKMLARHELRVLRGRNKALRVGEHSAASKVQAAHSPVERSDVLAALEWAQTKATSAAARRQVREAARSIDGAPVRRFGLKFDVFGMVVPSTGDEADEGGDDGDEDKKDWKKDDEDSEDEDDDDDDDEVVNDADNHVDDDAPDRDRLRPFTRPTKRTRLSSAGRRAGIPTDTEASRGALRTRTRGGGRVVLAINGVGRGAPPPGTEESEESEESESEPKDPNAGNESSGDQQHPTPEDMRAREREGGRTRQSNPAHTYTASGGSSAVSSGREDVEERGFGGTGGRSDKETTTSLLSWREEEDEEMDSESEQGQITTGMGSLDPGFAHEEGSGLEESNTKYGVEGDQHTGDEDERAGEHARWVEAQFSRKTLAGAASGSDMVHGQNQRVQLSTLHPTSPPVADRTVAPSLHATRSRQQHSSALTSGGDAPQARASPVHPGGGSPPSPPPRPTLLQGLQARHADAVRRLVKDLSRPHLSDAVMHQRRLQLDWLGPQRWARVYAEPEDRLGGSCVASPEEADVWYLGWDAFRAYAESGYVFRRPVVIKQEFQDSGAYDIVDYVDMLWQRFPEQQVEVQNSMTGACSSMSLAKYCLAVADVDLGSADDAAAISSATNLRRLARADEPLLSRLPRFRLLSTLADRVAGTVGRGGQLIPSDVQGGLGFNLLSFAGAFSGSHVDPLVGSWARCLSGVQVAAVAADLDDDEWRRFAREGRGWSPRGRGRLIALEQDDVLLMPPGLRAVRATFAPEPCLMEGAMLWDECAIPEILDGLLWVVNNRALADEAVHVAFQLSPLIDALEMWLDDKNYVGRPSSRATAAEQYQTVKAGIRSLRVSPRISP
ncbi:hypothetical protein EsH8_VII_000110 [Colletotrichum jinshuiense]